MHPDTRRFRDKLLDYSLFCVMAFSAGYALDYFGREIKSVESRDINGDYLLDFVAKNRFGRARIFLETEEGRYIGLEEAEKNSLKVTRAFAKSLREKAEKNLEGRAEDIAPSAHSHEEEVYPPYIIPFRNIAEEDLLQSL